MDLRTLDFGQLCATFRKSKDLTQEALGKLKGIDLEQGTISGIESGKHPPTAKFVDAVAKIFNLDFKDKMLFYYKSILKRGEVNIHLEDVKIMSPDRLALFLATLAVSDVKDLQRETVGENTYKGVGYITDNYNIICEVEKNFENIIREKLYDKLCKEIKKIESRPINTPKEIYSEIYTILENEKNK
jgi:transcriptional regulator with XRE-family HTH domain